MKTSRDYPRYTVSRKAEEAILRGHTWVYAEEVLSVEGEAENGGYVDVLSRKGSYLGTALLSEPLRLTPPPEPVTN